MPIEAKPTSLNHQLLLEKYQSVRSRTALICAPLHKEDMVVQPVVDVSPPKWHLAHTTWFFETFVLKSQQNYQEFHPDFGFLFNSYYNNVGDRVLRANRGNMSRPSTAQIEEYRAYVDVEMQRFISLNELDSELLSVIEIGLQHEQQHQELLLTDIKYILGMNPLFPAYDSNEDFDRIPSESPGFIQVSEGVHEIGFHGDGFCFDNELGRHKVFIQSFEIARSYVTFGEYIDFIEAGGYADFNLWHAEAWDWIQTNDVKAPLYLHQIDGKWMRYTLSGLKEVNPNHALVHVSYYEAAAYAAWKGMRLPTEFEWEVAATRFNWGKLWEWTNSAYLPYPGYQKAPGAIGEYNGKFMINQMVLRGASGATADGHSRITYRNFFHPHLQWQYAGIRLAK